MIHKISPTEQNLNALIAEAQAGDVFEFSAGDWYLQSPITIENKSDLIFRSATNERARFYGGIQLSQWEKHDDRVFKTKVPATALELFESGQRCELARWPKAGYAKSTNVTESSRRKRSFHFERSEFPEVMDEAHLKAHLWPSGPMGEFNWHTVDLDCEISGDCATLNTDTWFDLGIGTRFFLYNCREFLTDPGEFYIDPEEQMLYYIPLEGTVEGKEIILPLMKNIFHIVNSTNIELENVDLSCTDRVESMDGEVFEQDDAAVFIEQSSSIRIQGCEIFNTGLNGISMYRYVQNVVVENCHIHHIGHTGVRAYGDWESDEYMNRGHYIRNNHIHHLGHRVGQCAGIQMMQSGDTMIANNLVHDSARYAISLLAPNMWQYIGVPRFNDRHVQSYMSRAYSFVRNCTVINNEVFSCCQDSQDTGLIQSFCAGENNVIANNIVRDSEVPFSFGNGIYLDDHCDDFTIKNNLVYNLNHYGSGQLANVITIKGVGNKTINNRIIFCNVQKRGVFYTFSMGTKQNHSITIEDNILYENTDALIANNDWQEGRYKSVDNNLYYNSRDEYTINGALDYDGVISFNQWQRAGFDRYSRTENPRFVDAEQLDFRLRYDSPAFLLGHEEIPIAEIGLDAGYSMEQADDLALIFPVLKNEQGGVLEDTRSYANLKSGERCRLELLARGENRVISKEELTPKFELIGDSVRIDADGHIEALAPGVSEIVISVDHAKTRFYLLVDDEVVDIQFSKIPPRVSKGQHYPIDAVLLTRFGQYLPATGVEVTGVPVIGGQAFFNQTGSIKVFVTSDQFSTSHIIQVEKELLADMEIELPKVCRVNDWLDLTVWGIMSSGRKVSLSDFEVQAEDIKVENGQLIAQKTGKKRIRISAEGVTEEVFLSVAEAYEPKINLQLRQYGSAEGILDQSDPNSPRFNIYSTGRNVWYKSDDASFAHRSLERENLDIELVVHRIEETHRDTQCGILIKAKDTAESACIHLRVDAAGGLMLAARKEDGGDSKPIVGAPPNAKFGGTEGTEAEMSSLVSEERQFPISLRLKCHGSVFTASVKKQGGWHELGTVEVSMPEQVEAGVGFFSIDTAHCAKAEVELFINGEQV